MARHSADRDDLWAEVRALAPRGEWRIPGEVATVTAGRRREGRVSIYFGGDPAYHFDAAGRLRRAFVDGALFRSAGTTLTRLIRQQSLDESQLLAQDLTTTELADRLAAMQSRVQRFLDALDSGTAQLVRSEPTIGPDWSALQQSLRAGCAVPQLAPPLVTRRPSTSDC